MSIYSEAPWACVYCEQPTEFGSGKFVNRMPADHYHALPDGTTYEYRDGYACAECMVIDCDRCDKSIPIDEDIGIEEVYGEDWLSIVDRSEFDDGVWKVHLECLTPAEKTLYDATEEREA